MTVGQIWSGSASPATSSAAGRTEPVCRVNRRAVEHAAVRSSEVTRESVLAGTSFACAHIADFEEQVHELEQRRLELDLDGDSAVERSRQRPPVRYRGGGLWLFGSLDLAD